MNRWLRIVVSLGLLAITVHILDWDGIVVALREVSPSGLAWSFSVTLVLFAVLGYRWYLIVQPFAPRPALEHFRLYFVATYLNTFTPANLGGDIYRVLSLRSTATDTPTMVVAVLRERYLGLISYLLGYVLFLIWLSASDAGGADLPPLVMYAGAVTAFCAGLLLIAPLLLGTRLAGRTAAKAPPALRKGIEILDQAARVGSPAALAGLLGISVFGIALWTAAVKIVAADLGILVSWAALGAVVILTELLRMVPITLQGIGLREATFAYLLGLLGGSAESGFVLGAVSYVVLSCALIGCGIIGWLLPRIDSIPSSR